jgi:FkbH-like protein
MASDRDNALLSFVQRAHARDTLPANAPRIRIALVTNFTDDLLAKLLGGMCVAEGIMPDIYTVPFKQYLFELKDPHSGLAQHAADVTFVFFDANPYQISEFHSSDHADLVCEELEQYASARDGHIYVHTLSEPGDREYGQILAHSPLVDTIKRFNAGVEHLATKHTNITLIDTSRIFRREGLSRDMRGLYAFSQPFTNAFLFEVANEWMAHLRTRIGRARKCLVLDLDNVLWGGVVGEVGIDGIQLGPEYPGNAYLAFQETLLSLWNEGVVLAINSRNNTEDVDAVFAQHPYMKLTKAHFAAEAVNWETKADNMRPLADALNLGLDALVFIDDDPLNRDLVRTQHPDILVPEWSLPPEEYTRELLTLAVFRTTPATAEDRERGKSYAAEKERAQMRSTLSLDEYLDSLGIGITLSVNRPSTLPRLAQLTQKTNQFNLTTIRRSEHEVEALVEAGAWLYAGDVTDRFGNYGITLAAFVIPIDAETATLDTFLMSCRVMGRRAEQTFLYELAKDAASRGITTLNASFTETAKNAPARSFLADSQAELITDEGGTKTYKLDLASYIERMEAQSDHLRITVTKSHE